MEAQWYKAMGGDGLNVRRDSSSEWVIYGLIVKAKRGKSYDAILNRHEESYSLGLFYNLQQAMDYLLKRSGATLVEEAE